MVAGISSHIFWGSLYLLEKSLRSQTIEKRPLPTPENISLGSAFPLQDLPVGHGRSFRNGAGLHIDVPLLLGIGGELSSTLGHGHPWIPG